MRVVPVQGEVGRSRGIDRAQGARCFESRPGQALGCTGVARCIRAFSCTVIGAVNQGNDLQEAWGAGECACRLVCCGGAVMAGDGTLSEREAAVYDRQLRIWGVETQRR